MAENKIFYNERHSLFLTGIKYAGFCFDRRIFFDFKLIACAIKFYKLKLIRPAARGIRR
jgi:hypothetical protein